MNVRLACEIIKVIGAITVAAIECHSACKVAEKKQERLKA